GVVAPGTAPAATGGGTLVAAAGGLSRVRGLGEPCREPGTAVRASGLQPRGGARGGPAHPVPATHAFPAAGAAGYFDFFNGAGTATGRVGDRGLGWYSFDLGGWHVVALNSACGEIGGCGPGSPEEAWLRADLPAHPPGRTPG